MSSKDSEIYYNPKYLDPNPDCKHDWSMINGAWTDYITFGSYSRNITPCANCSIYKMEIVENDTLVTTQISFHETSPMDWMFKTIHDPVESFEYFGHLECPKCNSSNVADILFGLPILTERLQADLNKGRVVLGGCEIQEDFMPDFQCNKCSYQWDALHPCKGAYNKNDYIKQRGRD